MKFFFAISAAFALFASSLSAQATRWTLTTADFQSRQVDVESIEASGVRVRDSAGAAPRVVGWDNLLALDRSLDAKPSHAKFTLVLTSGDQLRGEPLRIEDETLTWNAAALGTLDLPLQQAAAITRAAPSPPRDRAAPTEDLITLANGDTVRGIISGLADNQLTIQVSGKPTPVPLDSIATIRFAATTSPAAPQGRAVRIRLADDSLITAESARTKADQLILTVASAERSIPLTSVAAIEQINGPVSWLSARPPSENVHTPMLQTPRPARMDRTVTGQPIRFGERTYARGIGVAPRSRLTWPLDPAQGYQAFRTQYAIDGPAPYADVTVRILLDGNVVHERAKFTAGQISPVILVPLGNARSLTLEVDFGGNYNVQDRLNWIEPALTKSEAPMKSEARSSKSETDSKSE